MSTPALPPTQPPASPRRTKKPSSRKLFGILFGLPIVLIIPIGLLGADIYNAGMIEVEIVEKGEHGTSIGISIPGAVVPVAMHFVPECTIDDVRCEMGPEAREAVRVAQAALKTISRGPDGVYVDVRTRDEVVLIEKEGNVFRVFVDTPSERVELSVPIGVASRVLAAI